MTDGRALTGGGEITQGLGKATPAKAQESSFIPSHSGGLDVSGPPPVPTATGKTRKASTGLQAAENGRVRD